jgi:hypothetical protein
MKTIPRVGQSKYFIHATSSDEQFADYKIKKGYGQIYFVDLLLKSLEYIARVSFRVLL